MINRPLKLKKGLPHSDNTGNIEYLRKLLSINDDVFYQLHRYYEYGSDNAYYEYLSCINILNNKYEVVYRLDYVHDIVESELPDNYVYTYLYKVREGLYLLIGGNTYTHENGKTCVDIKFMYDTISNYEDYINNIFSKEILPNLKKVEIIDKNHIYIIGVKNNGYCLLNNELKLKSESIENIYNDDFYEINSKIEELLSIDKSTGLFLFHGIPGTGKTTYLRYLTSKIKNRDIVYLPSNLVSTISAPNFITFLMDSCKNSILIIEDAEMALKDRSDVHNSAVSNLLNFSDGILGDILGISIICTFNCDLDKIDSALQRKGRCKYIYEFKKLSLDKCKLINDNITEPMTLADCFNFNESNNIIAKKKSNFGFKTSSIEDKITS